MGWKTATVIVTKPNEIDNETLLRELGFTNLQKINDEPFEVALNPDENRIFIGRYKGNLLVTSWEIAEKFFEEKGSIYQDIFTKLFPSSEICVIILHSTVNLWGYAVIDHSKLIRARAGSGDDGTFMEKGDPLPEEKDLLNSSTLHEDGKRSYLLEDADEEPMSEDQVGENFVFALTSRYFGEPLDMADDLLFETVLEGYSYSSVNAAKSLPAKTSGNTKPWWKFW